jgi:hypothetical protein
MNGKSNGTIMETFTHIQQWSSPHSGYHMEPLNIVDVDSLGRKRWLQKVRTNLKSDQQRKKKKKKSRRKPLSAKTSSHQLVKV